MGRDDICYLGYFFRILKADLLMSLACTGVPCVTFAGSKAENVPLGSRCHREVPKEAEKHNHHVQHCLLHF